MAVEEKESWHKQLKSGLLTFFSWVVIGAILAISFGGILVVGLALLALPIGIAALTAVCAATLLLPTLLGEMFTNPRAAFLDYCREIVNVTFEFAVQPVFRGILETFQGVFEPVGVKENSYWPDSPVSFLLEISAHGLTTIGLCIVIVADAACLLVAGGIVVGLSAIAQFPQWVFDAIRRGVFAASQRCDEEIKSNFKQFKQPMDDLRDALNAQSLPEATQAEMGENPPAFLPLPIQGLTEEQAPLSASHQQELPNATP